MIHLLYDIVALLTTTDPIRAYFDITFLTDAIEEGRPHCPELLLDRRQ